MIAARGTKLAPILDEGNPFPTPPVTTGAFWEEAKGSLEWRLDHKEQQNRETNPH